MYQGRLGAAQLGITLSEKDPSALLDRYLARNVPFVEKVNNGILGCTRQCIASRPGSWILTHYSALLRLHLD